MTRAMGGIVSASRSNRRITGPAAYTGLMAARPGERHDSTVEGTRDASTLDEAAKVLRKWWDPSRLGHEPGQAMAADVDRAVLLLTATARRARGQRPPGLGRCLGAARSG